MTGFREQQSAQSTGKIHIASALATFLRYSSLVNSYYIVVEPDGHSIIKGTTVDRRRGSSQGAHERAIKKIFTKGTLLDLSVRRYGNLGAGSQACINGSAVALPHPNCFYSLIIYLLVPPDPASHLKFVPCSELHSRN